MWESDENKTNGKFRMKKAIGNENSTAPMYEENPNSESLGNDLNMVYTSGNAPSNCNASAHGNAPSTSSTFLNSSINGNAPNNNGNAETTPP